MSISEEIRLVLREHEDVKYKAFQGALIPNLNSATMIGVRTPIMRKLAKQFAKHEDVQGFLLDVPHVYYEENVVHAFIIAEMKDYSRCMEGTEAFLPYVDNWAVCDGFSPKVFKKNLPDLFERCKLWLQSEHTYTVRFALVMLLKHFLKEPYAAEALRMAAEVDSDEYYVDMAVAWLFAEAVGVCPQYAIPYLESCVLKTEVHNKAIQKSVESRKVSEDTKEYLKTLKRKKDL